MANRETTDSRKAPWRIRRRVFLCVLVGSLVVLAANYSIVVGYYHLACLKFGSTEEEQRAAISGLRGSRAKHCVPDLEAFVDSAELSDELRLDLLIAIVDLDPSRQRFVQECLFEDNYTVLYERCTADSKDARTCVGLLIWAGGILNQAYKVSFRAALKNAGTEALLEALDDPQLVGQNARWHVASVLTDLDIPAAQIFPRLIDRLEKDSSLIVCVAEQFGTRAIPFLISALTDPREAIRSRVPLVLRAPPVRQFLSASAAKDFRDAWLREDFCSDLGSACDERLAALVTAFPGDMSLLLPTLREALASPRAAIREAAVERVFRLTAAPADARLFDALLKSARTMPSLRDQDRPVDTSRFRRDVLARLCQLLQTPEQLSVMLGFAGELELSELSLEDLLFDLRDADEVRKLVRSKDPKERMSGSARAFPLVREIKMRDELRKRAKSPDGGIWAFYAQARKKPLKDLLKRLEAGEPEARVRAVSFFIELAKLRADQLSAEKVPSSRSSGWVPPGSSKHSY